MDETSVLWRSAQPMLISFRPIGWWITRFLKPETFTCIWAAVVFAVPCHYWTWTWGCRVTDFWWKTGFRQFSLTEHTFKFNFGRNVETLPWKKPFLCFFFHFRGSVIGEDVILTNNFLPYILPFDWLTSGRCNAHLKWSAKENHVTIWDESSSCCRASAILACNHSSIYSLACCNHTLSTLWGKNILCWSIQAWVQPWAREKGPPSPAWEVTKWIYPLNHTGTLHTTSPVDSLPKDLRPDPKAAVQPSGVCINVCHETVRWHVLVLGKKNSANNLAMHRCCHNHDRFLARPFLGERASTEL